MSISLSLIVPTRGRVPSLLRLLDGLATLAAGPYEVVLVVDADDAPTLAVARPEIVRVVVPPGATMGALNDAGCRASHGEFVMLLNDDVVPRTPGWDTKMMAAARTFADGVVLVHANDTLMKQNLCVFPMLPRGLAAIPHGYRRYRIDDHVQHVFDMLAALGERRTVWLPDVVFEHLNGVDMPGGEREYHAEPLALAEDARTFDALAPQRRRPRPRADDAHPPRAHRRPARCLRPASATGCAGVDEAPGAVLARARPARAGQRGDEAPHAPKRLIVRTLAMPSWKSMTLQPVLSWGSLRAWRNGKSIQ